MSQSFEQRLNTLKADKSKQQSLEKEYVTKKQEPTCFLMMMQ
jgi:hypothetical protein